MSRELNRCLIAALLLGLGTGTVAEAADPVFLGEWQGQDSYSDFTVRFKQGGVYQRIQFDKVEEGAWEYGTAVCRATKDRSEGNLMIYGSNSHCCFTARLVGSRLALSYVAGIGSQCRDSTLLRKKP